MRGKKKGNLRWEREVEMGEVWESELFQFYKTVFCIHRKVSYVNLENKVYGMLI